MVTLLECHFGRVNEFCVSLFWYRCYLLTLLYIAKFYFEAIQLGPAELGTTNARNRFLAT